MPIVGLSQSHSTPLMPLADLISTGMTKHRLNRRITRYYFVWLALFSIIVAAVGFVPEFVKFLAGTFPIAWVLHVHSALMVAWLAIFFAQAALAATGRLDLHKKWGTVGLLLGLPVWTSMVFVEWRGKIVYPLDPDLSPEYDLDLRGMYTWAMFFIFFLGAVYFRQRAPAWHKRFMVFAAFMVLLPAQMRIDWLPRFQPRFWTDLLYLDLCVLLPLLIYDFSTTRRPHPATMIGAGVLLGAQGILLFTWGTPWWRHLAYVFTVTLRSYF
jgi:hypothetical protein